MAKAKSAYQEIRNSLREIRKKLRELRKSNADPEVIHFVTAHLRWIEKEVADHKNELGTAKIESNSVPPAKKTSN